MGHGNDLEEILKPRDYGPWFNRELSNVFRGVDSNSVESGDLSGIIHPLCRLIKYADGLVPDVYDRIEKKGFEVYGGLFDIKLIYGNIISSDKKENVFDYTGWIHHELKMALAQANSGNVNNMGRILFSIRDI
ncbi:MAG: hypothetical protein K0B07_02815 [DPANN group archaeon]|nr:hypothetical protein [DPANN group archaeon]